jgi:WD40 repeat protein
MNKALFEKYNLFIRGNDPEDLFSTPEQFELISYGILKKLTQKPDADSFDLIKTIITNTTDRDLQQTCFDDLVQLAEKGIQGAVTCLFELAIEYQNNTASSLIHSKSFKSQSSAVNAAYYLLTQQTKPLFNIKRPLYSLQSYYRQCGKDIQHRMQLAAEKLAISDWHFAITSIENYSSTSFDNILQTYNSMSTESKHFFLGQAIYQFIQGNQAFLDLLLDLFFHTEENILHNFLNSKLINHLTDTQYALFYLIDEQWQKLEQIDPANKLLQQAYHDADNYQRLKIMQKTRSAGIDLIASDILKQKKLINLNNLSYLDWAAIINSPVTSQQLSNLWQLAQIAPPYWAVQIIKILTENKFIPQSSDESAFLESCSANLPELPLEENKSLFIKEREFSLSSEFQYASIMADKGAFYSKIDNTIHFCTELNNPKPTFHEIIPPKPLMPAIQFSQDEKYLLWADVDQMINIYELRTNRIIKRFTAHKSIIRCLQTSLDHKHLLSASFDGSIQSWRFPDGFHEKEITASRNEIYAMVLSDLGEYLISGDINGKMQVISMISMECIHDMSANSDAILGFSNPIQQRIAAHTSSNQILIWNYLSQRILNQYESTMELGKTSKLLLTSDEDILIQATMTGNLLVRDSISGTLFEQSNADNSPALELAEQNHNLWVFHKNGNANMFNTQLLQLLLSPIKQSGDFQLKQLDELLSLPQITKFQKKWLEFIKILVHWQKRFDISIEEIQTSINIDDFSITI